MQGPFKKYAREPRTQLTEEVFASGMNYSNTPLAEGFLKEMVNMDIKDNGQTISPRPGLRAYKIGEAETSPITFKETHMINASRNCVEPDNVQRSQVVLTSIGSTVVPGTSLVRGSSSILTVTDKEGIYPSDTPTPHKRPGDEEGFAKATFLESTVSGYDFMFNVPGKAEIHGLELSSATPIAKQVGTFAYNNSFYAPCVNSAGASKLVHTKFDTKLNKYVFEDITPKATTPKEAVMWGYNMLAANPYSFTCTNNAAGVTLLGLLPFKNGNLVTSPKVNESVSLQCYYAASSGTFQVVWEWKELLGTEWTKLQDSSVSTASNQPFTVKEFSSPAPQVMIRISVYPVPTEAEPKPLPYQVMSVGMNFLSKEATTTTNLDPKTYTITKAKGFTYWKQRLVAYGVPEDPTLLFTSEVNDPSYFPFPGNSDIFEEPIMYAIAFLDDLLVFTTTQLYILKLNPDGLSWSKRLIQANLHINEWDLHLIKVVKNMVFFRSGNYYYMVVPKMNTNGELVIAPISKNIANLLDNFKQNVEKTLDSLYNYKEDITLVHYYNFLDYEDIHNVYVFQTSRGVYLNYTLLYNSMTRVWRVYIFESQSIVQPHKQDATQKGILVSLVERVGKLCLQFLSYSGGVIVDRYVPNGSGVKGNDVKFFRNRQMLDTGYRDHMFDYKKRYRELQLRFNNTAQQELDFYTEFAIDGELRKEYYKYNINVVPSPDNPQIGLISLDRLFDKPVTIPGATVLAVNSEQESSWRLNQSLFPEAVLWKVRIPVSGKGYAPRITLVSLNEYPYELLNIGWIFRTLYSR